MKISATKSLLLLFLSLISFSACEEEPEVVIHIDKDEFTLEDQRNIAKNLSYLISLSTSNYTILERSELPEFYAYIDQLFQAIVNTSFVENRLEFDWEVIILKDDEMRTAFTIPGGKIYIYTGLLKMIRAENELFSILAHEVYYSEKASIIEAMKEEYGSITVGDLSIGTNSEEAIELAETIYQLSFSTQEVDQADQFAMEVICPFQYDARALKNFLEMAKNTDYDVQWLITRHGSTNRIGNIESWSDGCGVEEPSFSTRYSEKKSLLP